jgi:aminomethyltransferase
MGYALHGHELSVDINPIEAGVSWAVGWKKNHFHGRTALNEIRTQGASRRSVALIAKDRTIPRAGMKVKSGENLVGEVTSGTFSPNLKVGIALALVSPAIELGDIVEIDVRGRAGSYEVVKAPFVPSRVR